jgi:hypothetical protein
MAKITAKKYEGNDSYSWAVFVDRRPVYTGLTKREVPHYKALALKHLEIRI